MLILRAELENGVRILRVKVEGRNAMTEDVTESRNTPAVCGMGRMTSQVCTSVMFY